MKTHCHARSHLKDVELVFSPAVGRVRQSLIARRLPLIFSLIQPPCLLASLSNDNVF